MRASPDWNVIEAGYKAGRVLRELAQEHGVTHPAIVKQAARDGWKPFRDAAEIGYRSDVPRKQLFIGHLSCTGNHIVAALCAGVRAETPYSWRASDAAFDAAYDRALVASLARIVRLIERDANRSKPGARRAYAHYSKQLAVWRSRLPVPSDPHDHRNEAASAGASAISKQPNREQ